jgi:hypothetical protein
MRVQLHVFIQSRIYQKWKEDDTPIQASRQQENDSLEQLGESPERCGMTPAIDQAM